MNSKPRLNGKTIDRAHTGGFVSAPMAPPTNSSVRIVLAGIAGPPAHWKPVYSALEEVCRPMLFPFSPDQPGKDKAVCGNVVEYAEVASDLKGNVIAGQPTMVFCMPGLDRNRRFGLFAEMIPRVLSHHDIYGSLLYFSEDTKDLYAGIIEAKIRGFETRKLAGRAEDFDKESYQRWWANWLKSLDPMN